MPDRYAHYQTFNTHRTMTVLFDNLFNASDVIETGADYLHQEEVETLSPEEFSYYLAHGSLDTDAEVY